MDVLQTTMALALMVTLAATVLGVALALLMQYVRIPIKALFIALCVMPLAIPSYVLTYTWIALIPGFRGFWAATLVLTVSTMPYVFLAAMASLQRVDHTQVDVAKTLGLDTRSAFAQVIWPQIRNSVAAGALLVALYVLSDFGAVSLLNVDTFTRSIQNIYRGSFDRSAAASLSLLLVAIAAIVIMTESRFQRRSALHIAGVALTKRPTLSTVPSTRIAAITLPLLYAFVGLVIPGYVLISRFANNPRAVDLSELLSASLATVLPSALAALFVLLLALPVSLLLATKKDLLANLAERGMLLSNALPGIVMGLALVSLGSRIPWAYQTVGLLALAYALLFMAKAVGSMRTAVGRVPQNLLDISATLGQSRLATFRRITLPLASPGVITGLILVFLSAMKELPATLMLRPTGFETLATRIWAETAINRFSEAAPYAITLIVIAALPTFLINRPDKTITHAEPLELENFETGAVR